MDWNEIIRALAMTQAKTVRPEGIFRDPIGMLNQVRWNIPMGQPMDQRTVADMNITLSPKSCLGRVALAAALVEKYFKSAELRYGEVWQDGLRDEMLLLYKENPEDITILEEVLIYEEPHAVLVCNGVQFDPIFTFIGRNLRHPVVQEFPVWEAIASSRFVSRAWMAEDMEEKSRNLSEAEKICPGTTLVMENLLGMYAAIGNIPAAVDIGKKLLQRRPTARLFFSMYSLTFEKKYFECLVERYGINVVDCIEKEVAAGESGAV